MIPLEFRWFDLEVETWEMNLFLIRVRFKLNGAIFEEVRFTVSIQTRRSHLLLLVIWHRNFDNKILRTTSHFNQWICQIWTLGVHRSRWNLKKVVFSWLQYTLKTLTAALPIYANSTHEHSLSIYTICIIDLHKQHSYASVIDHPPECINPRHRNKITTFLVHV